MAKPTVRPKPAPPPPPPRAAARTATKPGDARSGARALDQPMRGVANIPLGKGKGIRPRPPIEEDAGGDEHRQFPRAKMGVPFKLWIGEGDEQKFGATLRSVNISVSGAFLESTFFLPTGTVVNLSFQLDEDEDPVIAEAEVIREERPDARTGQGRSGMGLRFVQFFSQTEVTLAKLFLGEQLAGFAEIYLASKRAKSLTSEFERVVDALAAWELLKVTTPGDPWGGAAGPAS